MPVLDAARNGRLAKPLRKAVLAASYFFRSGVYSDWSRASRAYWPVLARRFKPDATWGTFGDSDAPLIARAIARHAECPWFLDLKDPWSVFIPPPMRRLLARRFADAAGFSCLSRQHGLEIERWFGQPGTVVYSGIDPVLLPPVAPLPENAPPRLVLLGSLYNPAHLAQLMHGNGQWLDTAPAATRASASLVYAGTEIDSLRNAARGLNVRVETPGWCDLDGLRRLGQNATALLYVRSPQALYQHKGLELAALDRPILCLPDESDETKAVLSDVSAPFRSCRDPAQVAQALADIHAAPHRPACDRDALARYSWDAQAARLAAMFERR
jgi:hypothetical protein